MDAAPPPPGFFGKVPARGDFLSRRVPAALAPLWEEWLQVLTATARDAAGEGWPEYWLTAPLWHFALGAGLAPPHGAAGVLVASADRVGRLFPFTVLGACDPGQQPDDAALARWGQAAEELVLDALEDGFDPAELDAALAELGPPPPVTGPGEAPGVQPLAESEAPAEAGMAPPVGPETDAGAGEGSGVQPSLADTGDDVVIAILDGPLEEGSRSSSREVSPGKAADGAGHAAEVNPAAGAVATDPKAEEAVASILGEEPDLDEPRPALAAADANRPEACVPGDLRPGPGQSVWWCRGSDRVAPVRLRCAGLPTPDTAAAMMLGGGAVTTGLTTG